MKSMKRTLILLCLLLGSVMLGVALGIAWIFPQAHTTRKVSAPARVTGTPTASSIHYLYYALKSSQGFMLARAQKGTDGRPLGAPQPLTMIGDGFGQTESDSVS